MLESPIRGDLIAVDVLNCPPVRTLIAAHFSPPVSPPEPAGSFSPEWRALRPGFRTGRRLVTRCSPPARTPAESEWPAVWPQNRRRNGRFADKSTSGIHIDLDPRVSSDKIAAPPLGVRRAVNRAEVSQPFRIRRSNHRVTPLTRRGSMRSSRHRTRVLLQSRSRRRLREGKQ
jgi:hypothetical protein